MLRIMQRMALDLVSLEPAPSGQAMEAVLIGRSERRRDGVPEAVFVMKLRLSAGASAQDARDLALEYLDPE